MKAYNNLNEFPDYPKYVDAKIEILQENFTLIKGLLNFPCTNDNFNIAFQSFVKIIEIIPLMSSKIEIKQIVRGRKNDEQHPTFSEEWEISYNMKFADYIQLGRFNRKAEPLFYGSLPVESKHQDYVLSCALECCKELTDSANPVDLQDITIGGWLVKEPFNVINLCFDENHLSYNPTLKEATQKYLEMVKNNFAPVTSNFIFDFLRYFSEMSRTIRSSDSHYYITTALFVAIRWHYKHREKNLVYGLIYPAAMSEAKGLNIVVTRKAVDLFLQLDKVVMYRYCIVKPEQTSYIAEPCSALAMVNNNRFTITNYRPKGGNRSNVY